MAQGEGTRWQLDNPYLHAVPRLPREKHLINIGKHGTPNLHRTLCLLKYHGYPYVTIVARPWANVGASELTVTLGDPTGPLLNGLHMTQNLWVDNKTIVLLGDVIYSHAMIHTMLLKPGLHFYGRIGANKFTGKEASELFAMTFHKEHHKEIIEHCEWMTAFGSPRKYPPKLWALYRLLAGFDHADESKFEDEILVQLNDYTDDIDSIQGYLKWWNALNTHAAQDDDACELCWRDKK